MEQTVVVSLEEKHYNFLNDLSEAWGKRPEEILKLICEKALDTASKNMAKGGPIC